MLLIKVGYIARCEESSMVATGIPPLLKAIHEVNDLKRTILNMEKLHKEQFEKLMQAILIKVPQEVVNEILRQIRVEGAQGVTPREFSAFEERMTNLFEDLASRLETNQHAAVPNALMNGTTTTAGGQTHLDQDGCKVFEWGGSLHPIPQDFMPPKTRCGVKVIWDQWHFASFNNHYQGTLQPLMKVNTKIDLSPDAAVRKAQATVWTKLTKVITYLLCIGNDLNLDLPDTSQPGSRIAMDGYFALVYAELCTRMKTLKDYPTDRHVDTLSYYTVYKDILAYKRANNSDANDADTEE